MVSALQKFLKSGFIKSQFKNLPTRRFITHTSHEFYEWIQDPENNYGVVGIKHIKKSLYNDFVTEYPDFGPRGKIYSQSLNMVQVQIAVERVLVHGLDLKIKSTNK